MTLLDDGTVPNDAVLLRVIVQDPNWTTRKAGRYRPTRLAFFSTQQEISCFVDAPGIIAEIMRIFPGLEIACVPASVIRDVDFAIERRPDECPDGFRCDRNSHVVIGPTVQLTRNEHERRAGSIARHLGVTIINLRG